MGSLLKGFFYALATPFIWVTVKVFLDRISRDLGDRPKEEKEVKFK